MTPCPDGGARISRARATCRTGRKIKEKRMILEQVILEQDLVEAVREQAKMYPDRVYQAGPAGVCTYLPSEHNPDFGCIVGEALLWLGVPRELVTEMNTSGGWARRADRIRPTLGNLVAEAALRSTWVAQVQQYQDEGKTWAEAVRMAVSITGEVAQISPTTEADREAGLG
jgi:hypothetical protein